MKTALVTGSTGFVGSQLCRELSANGYRVRALHRKTGYTKKISGLPGLELFAGDLTDRASLEAACRGADFVFNIAALYREAKFADHVYWDVNLGGTQNLLAAAEKCGVKKFIHCSTIGVHSSIARPPADESEPYSPTDVYQESKVAAEKHVLEAFKNGRIQGCVIRPAMIWGPHDKRFLKFFRGVYRRRMPLIGKGEIFCHWILVEDLARAFRLAAESDRSNGQVYIIAGSRPVTLKHTMQTIADFYKVKLLPFRLPVLPIQLAGSIVEKLCRPLGIEPPIHRRRADFFIKNRAFDCSKAARDFGFQPRYSFEDEAAYIAGWYRDNGWLGG